MFWSKSQKKPGLDLYQTEKSEENFVDMTMKVTYLDGDGEVKYRSFTGKNPQFLTREDMYQFYSDEQGSFCLPKSRLVTIEFNERR